MTKHLLSLLIGLTFVTGCQSTPEAPQSNIGPVPPRSFVEQWEARVPLQNDQIERLYVRGDYLFAYTANNRVHAINRASGVLGRVYQPTRPNDRLFPPIVTQDEIFFPTHTTIEAYAREGNKHRSIDLDVSISTPAVEENGRLFFGTDFARGGRIMEADMTRNYAHLGWEVMTLGGLSAAPVIHSHVLYFGGEDGRVYAVTTDREHAWPLERSSFETGGRIVADIKVDDYGVYVPVETGVLYVLDRSNGKLKWQYFAERGLRTPPVVGPSQVYQYVEGKGIVAIDKLQGEFSRRAKWTAPDAREVVSMDNDYVYVRMRDNSIAALAKQTGEVRFRSKRSDFATFATNTENSTIYAATKNGQVFAITPVLKPGVVGQIVLHATPLPLETVGL